MAEADNVTSVTASNAIAAIPPTADPASAGRRTVTITDRLGPNQQYERIQVFIRGQRVAVLAIDDDQRSQSFPIDVRNGDEYTLAGAEATRDDDGVVRTRTIRGGGAFNLGDRDDYSVIRTNRTLEVTTYELRPR